MLAQGSQGSHVCGPICKSNSLVEASPAKSRHYCRNFPSPESQDSLSVQFSSLQSRGHPDEMGWEAKLAWPAEHEVGSSLGSLGSQCAATSGATSCMREATLHCLAERDDRLNAGSRAARQGLGGRGQEHGPSPSGPEESSSERDDRLYAGSHTALPGGA